MRKCTALLFLMFAVIGGTYAATYVSIQDGPWNSPSTWSPSVVPPTGSWSSDQIIINHDVTYSGNLSFGGNVSLTVDNGGSLAISGNFSVNSQGILQVKAGSGLSCVNFTYTAQGIGSFSSAGTLQATKLTVFNHSNAFTLSGNSVIGTLETNNGGGLTLNGGTLTVNDTDLRGGGKIVNNGGTWAIANTLGLKQGFTIELDGDGEITAGTVDLKGGSSINGINNGGVLAFTNISMQNGTHVRCAANLCDYDPGGGFSGNTPPSPIDLETGSQVVLPVELTAFSGKEDNGQIRLYWTTAQEINNDYFEVQRSTDGRHFEVIAKVYGVGNSNTPIHYEALDQQPVKGLNYYRLRQVDFDESEDYSSVITVNLSGEKSAQLIRLWPNPVVNELYLERSSENTVPNVQLYSTTGQIIPLQVQWNGIQARVFFSDSLPDGMYFLQFDGETHRVMVGRN